MQLLPVPDKLLRQESALLSSLLHVARNSFRRADFYAMQTWGLPVLRGLHPLGLATLARAALRTITNWQQLHAWYKEIYEYELPQVQWVVKKTYSPLWWDAPAFVTSLKWAAEGFTGFKALRGQGKASLTLLEG